MTTVKQVRAFVGFQGSGKSYICNKLVKEQGFYKMSYANPLRKMAFQTIGMDFKEGMKRYDELKQTDLVNGMTFRNILENLGSAVRGYDRDFWARALTREIENDLKHKAVCIDDLRYPNEYRVLASYCKEKKISLALVMCDYRSDRYVADNMHESTELSRYLLDKGYKHMQIIQPSDVLTLEHIQLFDLRSRLLKQ